MEPKRIPREDQIIRKNEAEQFLAHPLTREFLTKMEERLYEEFVACESKEVLEVVLFKKRGLEAFRQWLQAMIIDGQMAEAELKQQGKL